MRTTAMRHQRAAVNKLAPLKVGALFADMGTGKSRVFYEWGLGKVAAGKASRLVVLCPVSGRLHLAAEARKHAEALVAVHEGDYSTPAAEVNIIGTESMSSSIRALNRLADLCRDAVVVVDESQQIKNRKADRTRRILDVTQGCRFKMVSTGTPMSNGVEDLYSQCLFLSPLVLGYRSYSEFSRMHLRHEGDWCGNYGQGRVIGRFNTELIARRLAPYSFEARKADCLDLPPKTFSFKTAAMGCELSELYGRAKAEILAGQRAFDADDATIFRLFTALQMLACGQMPTFLAGLMKLPPDLRLMNPKLPLLMETVAGLPTGAKAVVWCKYLAESDAAAQMLEDAGHGVARMDGRMRPVERHAALELFRRDRQILVATTAVGGSVLDMGFAEFGVYLSNGFDYQQREQSEDRLHRNGMVGGAHYVDLFTECGIERRIQRSLARKEDAAKAFMDHVRKLRALPSREAVEALQQEVEAL